MIATCPICKRVSGDYHALNCPQRSESDPFVSPNQATNESWFPLKVKYYDNDEEEIVQSPKSIAPMRPFKVLETKVQLIKSKIST